MKHYITLILGFSVNFCFAQESIILEKNKIEWKDYSSIFEDSENREFVNGFQFLENIDIYEITYLSDGLNIQSFAAIPKKEGKYPVIIFNRGGNRDFGALQLFKGEYKYPVAYKFSKLAKEGYVVIGCNYRGSGESEGEEEFGGSDVNDVLNLLNVIKEIPEADESRIGMFGWSRGGMMTYIALTKTNQIKAAAVGGAPSDLTIIDRPEMEVGVYAELIPDYLENKDRELKKRSAYYFANNLPKEVPILMLHGNADWRVKSSNSLKLAMEFDKLKLPYRLKVYEGGDHGLTDYRADVHREVINWFNRFLKNDEQVPEMEFHGN